MSTEVPFMPVSMRAVPFHWCINVTSARHSPLISILKLAPQRTLFAIFCRLKKTFWYTVRCDFHGLELEEGTIIECYSRVQRHNSKASRVLRNPPYFSCSLTYISLYTVYLMDHFIICAWQSSYKNYESTVVLQRYLLIPNVEGDLFGLLSTISLLWARSLWALQSLCSGDDYWNHPAGD